MDFKTYEKMLASDAKNIYYTVEGYGLVKEDDNLWCELFANICKLADEGARLADFWEFALIIHDKDTNDDGTPKKPHWHLMIKGQGNGRTHKQVLGDLMETCQPGQVTVEMQKLFWRFIQKCDGKYTRYLLHGNSPTKHQYTADELKGTEQFRQKVIEDNKRARMDAVKFQRKEEEVTAVDFLSWYETSKYAGPKTVSSLVRFAMGNGEHKMVEYIASNTIFVRSFMAGCADDERKAMQEQILSLTVMVKAVKTRYRMVLEDFREMGQVHNFLIWDGNPVAYDLVKDTIEKEIEEYANIKQ